MATRAVRARTLRSRRRRSRNWQIVLIEDNAARSERRTVPGVRSNGSLPPVVVRLHEISGEAEAKELKKASIDHGTGRSPKTTRSDLALRLLKALPANERSRLIVAGPTYACSRAFQEAVLKGQHDFVGELRPSTAVKTHDSKTNHSPRFVSAAKLLSTAQWRDLSIFSAAASKTMTYSAAEIGEVQLRSGASGRLIAAQIGRIHGLHQGTIIGFSSNRTAELKDLLQALGWVRWIRPIVRHCERNGKESPAPTFKRPQETNGLHVKPRSNIALARKQDDAAVWAQNERRRDGQPNQTKPSGASSSVVRVGELFAGAGGMGLGFLLADHSAKRCRLIFSAEVNPIYARTLELNHQAFMKWRRADREAYVPGPVEPIDLRERKAFDVIKAAAAQAGGLDVLIGGPPCQGFSSANRNSWYRDNPHNRLMGVFARYVEKLSPKVFLMENVQGIVWTAQNGKADSQPSVVDYFAKRMRKAGYLLFPKLLDAVWYGVPQYRTRFFMIGLREDIGYRKDSFGSWGPFPRPTHGPGTANPYTTVRQAIADLPRLGNGSSEEQRPYSEPSDNALASNEFLRLMRHRSPKRMIWDHVTSRHADYVIKRYKAIPAGGNWEDIAQQLTNYSDVKRTHSNIYRRLTWNEPSITIGHYRKSMLVHPAQHRGLSLREASRLQSFPDWFRFAGNPDNAKGGLVHKQQQLANAVCPLVTKAVAEFILEL